MVNLLIWNFTSSTYWQHACLSPEKPIDDSEVMYAETCVQLSQERRVLPHLIYAKNTNRNCEDQTAETRHRIGLFNTMSLELKLFRAGHHHHRKSRVLPEISSVLNKRSWTEKLEMRYFPTCGYIYGSENANVYAYERKLRAKKRKNDGKSLYKYWRSNYHVKSQPQET